MSKVDIVRAWKCAEYRESLSPEQRAALPPSPVGAVELTDDELREVGGGILTVTITVAFSCMSCWKGTCNTAICDLGVPGNNRPGTPPPVRGDFQSLG